MWVKEGQPRLGEIGPESDDENLEEDVTEAKGQERKKKKKKNSIKCPGGLIN